MAGARVISGFNLLTAGSWNVVIFKQLLAIINRERQTNDRNLAAGERLSCEQARVCTAAAFGRVVGVG